MQNNAYIRGFFPYALAAFLIGIVGGFSAVLGPAFVQDIGISYTNTTWTALAQAMSTAACAPVLGRVGDKIGRRTTLLLGLAVFMLGNVLSALADSLLFMLAARFVVGVGTAAMTPVILSYIVICFPRDRITKGFSLYMLISGASVVFGPTLGGLLISACGWRVMVWVCVAICAVVFAACLITAKGEEAQTSMRRKFDTAGAVAAVVFFGLILCIPSFGQNFGWDSAEFLGVLLGAAVGGAGLALAERKAEHPILSGRFIMRRTFVISVLALFLTQGLMQANMTNMIVFVNYTQPGNTAISGYAISVMYIGMSLGAVVFGPLADKIEPKRVLIGSLLLTGIGCAVLSFFSEMTSVLQLMAALGLLGLGLGGNGTVFLKVALYGLPHEEAGAATGTYGLFRDLAAPFGVAVFVPLFTNRITELIAEGTEQAAAAVRSVRALSVAELICVGGGIAAVCFLPNIRSKGEVS